MMFRSGAFLPQKLDVDEGILDRNLRVVNDIEDGDFLFEGEGSKKGTSSSSALGEVQRRPLLPEPELPSVEVTPEPGMCIKTKNLAGTKVFLNLCRVNEIPPAPPMSEARLKTIIEEEDYASDYRVPMSLGAPREEADKSGQPCLACDVAVNSAWFADTVSNSDVFTAFVVHVAMEGLREKYGDDVNLDRQNWTMLKNKKYLGKPQRHRIQQRAKGNRIEVMDDSDSTRIEAKTSKPLIQEISKKTVAAPTKSDQSQPLTPDARPAVSSERTDSQPSYKIFKEPRQSERPTKLVTTVDLPGVRSVRDLTLDIGEDRLVLEARKAGYLLDIFLPFSLDCESCSAQFHRDKQVLTVHMPVVN